MECWVNSPRTSPRRSTPCGASVLGIASSRSCPWKGAMLPQKPPRVLGLLLLGVQIPLVLSRRGMGMKVFLSLQMLGITLLWPTRSFSIGLRLPWLQMRCLPLRRPSPSVFPRLRSLCSSRLRLKTSYANPCPDARSSGEGQDGFECRLARFRCQHGDKYEFFYLRRNGNQGREEAAVFNDLSFQDALDTFPDEVRLVARETTRDSGKPSSTSAHSPAQPLSSHEELVKLVIELKDGFFQPMDACSKSWHGEDSFERRLGECCELHGPGKFFYIGKGGKEAVFNECSFKDALDAFKDKDEVTLLMRKAEMSDSRQYSSTSIEKAGPQDSCQASAAEARMVA